MSAEFGDSPLKSSLIAIGAVLLISCLAIYWGGVTLEGELLAAAGSAAIFAFALITGSRSINPLGNRAFLIPLALLLAGVLIALFSPFPSLGRIELARLVSCALLLTAFLLLRCADSSRLLFHLSGLALGAGLVIHGVMARGGVDLSGSPLTATYVNRNHLAALLGLILLPAVCFSLGSKPRGAVWLSRVALPVLLGGILLTKSRGGILGATAGIGAVCLISLLVLRPRPVTAPARRKLRILIAVFVILLLAFAAVYAWFRVPESFPISAPHPEVLSIRTRLSIWRSTLGIFFARPVAGWGWGTFRHLYPAFKEAGVWYTVPHAHNEFLQLLAEGGVIGFSLAVFSLVLAGRELVKRYLASPESISGILALGAAGSLIYAAVHSGFDFILRLPANALFLAALVGLGLSGAPVKMGSPEPAGRRAVKMTAGLAIAAFLAVFLVSPLFRLYRSEAAAREGELILAAGRPEEARETFSRAHQLDPSSVRPLLGRAAAGMAVFDRAEDRIELYNSILKDLAVAGRNNPRDTRPPRDLGRFHQRCSAFAEAGKFLEEALALDPLNPHLHYELAENDLHRGEYLSAARRLRRANEIYPMMWGASWKLLFSQTWDYEILKELPPREGKYHRLMGYYLQESGNVDGAGKEFSKAVELEPDEPENWRALGWYYSRNGYPEESLPCYRRALFLSPGNHQWWAEMGDLLRTLDMLEEALDAYLQARDLEPGRRGYSEKVGTVIFSLKGPAAAIAFWGEVSTLDEGWSRPHYLRARLFLEEGKPEPAEKEIAQALAREPGNRHYSKLKARIEALLLREGSR